MSRLQQYLVFGIILLVFRWTPMGKLWQSPTLLNVILGIIVFLLVVAIAVTWPEIKKKINK